MSSSTLDSLGDSRPNGLLGVRQALLICVIVAVGGFEALWFGVVTDTGLAAADPSVIAWVVAHRGIGLVAAARVVSDVGGPAVTLAAAVTMLGWLGWKALWVRSGLRRYLLGGLACCCLIVVGVSRVVLAVHFPSDVFAGWALAIFAVTAVATADMAWTRRAPA